jgi:hypothetical protein
MNEFRRLKKGHVECRAINARLRDKVIRLPGYQEMDIRASGHQVKNLIMFFPMF